MNQSIESVIPNEVVVEFGAPDVATSADGQYWSAMWEQRELRYMPDELPFKDVFARHVPKSGDCIEIGCYPGGYLIYLSTQFGLRVHGVDNFSGVGRGFAEYLSRHGANVGAVTEGDFFQFKPTVSYDLVCSFGFIEHFYDFRSVLRRHAALVKPGGLLIVTCPNFRRVQLVLHWLFDRSNLRKHVIAAMDMEAWRTTLCESGMEIVEMGYSETFLFWTESSSRLASWIGRRISKLGMWVNSRFNRPNRFTSPFMYCVAKKVAAAGPDA
jgi:cyclopropane fatty-acyl-phospholipid synthase-like methyltransferase